MKKQHKEIFMWVLLAGIFIAYIGMKTAVQVEQTEIWRVMAICAVILTGLYIYLRFFKLW